MRKLTNRTEGDLARRDCPQVLVVDDELFARRFFELILSEEGYDCVTLETIKACTDHLAQNRFPDLMILDMRLPDGNGLDLMTSIRRQDRDLPIIIITAFGSISGAVDAMKMGAFDFLTKPFDDPDKIKISIRNALEYKRLAIENRLLRSQLQNRDVFQSIVGKSEQMGIVYDLIKKAARVTSNVLIEGESGTGKELVAQAVHNLSNQKNRAFIPVNCAALPENLLESSLFGFEKGSFTGALKTTKGFFEEAHGGTLLLDEIQDAPSSVQVKILRAIQDNAIFRIGNTRPISVRVRLICSSNRDLGKVVADGKFREDLYYRINVIKISVPALRERKDDIPLLVEHFLQKYSLKAGVKRKKFRNGAISHLTHHDWPGNVRELENCIERIVALHPGEVVTQADLMDYGPTERSQESSGEFDGLYEKAKKYFEKRYFEKLIVKSGGDLIRAAELSGIHLATLYRKIRSLDIRYK